MRAIISVKAFCLKAGLIFLTAAVLFTSSALSVHVPAKNLRGPAFSDPGKRIEMPGDWHAKPIKHNPASSDADLVVSLDGQMYPAWERIIRRYAKEEGLKIYIARGTCGVSTGGLSKKSIDVGVFCCPPDYTDRLPGVRFHTVGIAAKAFLVHPGNPVENITIDQARRIYQGAFHLWSELDRRARKGLMILPVARLHCSSRPGHWRLLMDNEELFSPDVFEVGAIPDMVAKVASTPGAIGNESLWMTRYHADQGKVKFLRLNGYSPDDPSHVASGKYPLYRVFNFTTWEGKETENRHARKLVAFIMKEAELLDPKFGLVPASKLKKAGWIFKDDELVGEPEQRNGNAS